MIYRSPPTSVQTIATGEIDCRKTPGTSRRNNTKKIELLKNVDELLMESCDIDRDDCSVTSTTLSCSSLESSYSCETSLSLIDSSGNRRRKVSFDMSQTQLHRSPHGDKDDIKDLWYKAPDFQRFRTHTSALAKYVRNSDEKHSYRDCTRVSYEAAVLRAYDVCRSVVVEPTEDCGANCCPVDLDLTWAITQWIQRTPGRVGLEQRIVKDLGREEGYRRSEIVDTVLAMQELGGGDSKDDLTDECIRRSSEHISRPSRLFARCLAEAQAAAVYPDPQQPSVKAASV